MANKQNEISVVFKGSIDPQLMRALSDLSKGVTDLDKNLNQLLRSKGLDKIKTDAKKAFDDVNKNAQNMGKSFKNTPDITKKVSDKFSSMSNEEGILDEAVVKKMFNIKEVFDNLKEGAQRIGDTPDIAKKVSDKLKTMVSEEGTLDEALMKKMFNIQEVFDNLKGDAQKIGESFENTPEFNIIKKVSDKLRSIISEEATLDNTVGEAIGTNAEGMAQAGASDALGTIIGKLTDIDVSIEQQTGVIKTLGDQYKNQGQKVFHTLSIVENPIDLTANTIKQIEEMKSGSLLKESQAPDSEPTSGASISLGEVVLPVLQDMAAATLMEQAAPIGRFLLGTARFFTNPIGLAIGAVGALTAGVIAYKNYQEEARQALFNMGDAINEAYDNYSGIQEQTERTRTLINEYDLLQTKISDSATPAEEVVEARKKLAEVENELIELNPEILKAEDAKMGKFREYAGLANQLNETMSEMAKRELEISVMEGESKLPELEREYESSLKKRDESNALYHDSKKGYTQYADYINKHQDIVNNPDLSLEEMHQQIDKLVEEIESETGRNYKNDIANLYNDFEYYKNTHKTSYEDWKNAQEDISEAEQSFQTFYENKVTLIEDELGAPIEEMVSKYHSLSDAEKDLTTSALRNIQELNTEVDKIPPEKRIDVTTMFHSIAAQPPSIPGYVVESPMTSSQNTASGQVTSPEVSKMPSIYEINPLMNYAPIHGYATGGRVTSPELAWIGEGGSPEWIIPENNSKRSHALYAAAGEALGYNPGGNFAPVYSPQIIIKGQANEQVIRATLRDSQREWEQNMLGWQRQQQRRSLVGS